MSATYGPDLCFGQNCSLSHLKWLIVTDIVLRTISVTMDEKFGLDSAKISNPVTPFRPTAPARFRFVACLD
jgi:hypothetical protein